MQAAAEVDQPSGTVDQRCEHVRRKGVDRKGAGRALGRRAAASLRVDARVVDDCIHAPDRVDLIRDAPGFGGAAEIADHNPDGPRRKLCDRRGAVRGSGVQHHLMAASPTT